MRGRQAGNCIPVGNALPARAAPGPACALRRQADLAGGGRAAGLVETCGPMREALCRARKGRLARLARALIWWRGGRALRRSKLRGIGIGRARPTPWDTGADRCGEHHRVVTRRSPVLVPLTGAASAPPSPRCGRQRRAVARHRSRAPGGPGSDGRHGAGVVEQRPQHPSGPVQMDVLGERHQEQAGRRCGQDDHGRQRRGLEPHRASLVMEQKGESRWRTLGHRHRDNLSKNIVKCQAIFGVTSRSAVSTFRLYMPVMPGSQGRSSVRPGSASRELGRPSNPARDSDRETRDRTSSVSCVGGRLLRRPGARQCGMIEARGRASAGPDATPAPALRRAPPRACARPDRRSRHRRARR